MSQKRHPQDGMAGSEGNSSEDKKRRFTNLKNVVMEVMRKQSVQHLLEPVLEPLIRRVVKEEIELALKKHLTSLTRNDREEINSTKSRSLQLKFVNNLSLPVFTGARIEGEDCSTLTVALVDALNTQTVNYGRESSARVEIVVLEGDFDSHEGDNWTLEDFRSNIVREREGKKPLLTGDAIFALKEGTGSVGEISFTDNSSWTRSRRFRLGARIVDSSDGTRVREAKTESFIVRDHRGELYKKHHPPSLFDEVWRLEKIGKDGAFHKRLSRENVNTVKDFLILLFIDPPRLRNILSSGMSSKMWEVTVEHARTCVLDKRIYLYCLPGSLQKTGVVFNVVGQLTGIVSESVYVPVDKLSETEKAEAQNRVRSAFQHWEDVVSFDNEASVVGGSSHITNSPYTLSSPRIESSYLTKILASNEIDAFDYSPPPGACQDIIMSSLFSTGDESSLDGLPLQNMDDLGARYDQTLSFPSQVTNSLLDTDSMAHAFCDEDHLRYFDTDHSHLESQADLQSAVNGYLMARSVGKAQTRWTQLFSVLKWFSIKRIVASKKSKVGEIQRGNNGP